MSGDLAWTGLGRSYGSGSSDNPDPAIAIGEAIATVLDQVGIGPTCALLFVTSDWAPRLDEMVDTVRTVLRPVRLVAVASGGVVGDRREFERGPAVALWATTEPGVVPVRLSAERVDERWRLHVEPEPDDGHALVAITDPLSFPVGALEHVGGDALPILGGMISPQHLPGTCVFAIDDERYDGGAVGLLVPDECVAGMVVSQGCRPVGSPYTVTASHGHHIVEIGGQRSLDRLRTIVESADDRDRALMTSGLQIGVAAVESSEEPRRGDFLVRAVAGADTAQGAIVVADEVPVGATVQFQVRDGDAAAEDLEALLTAASGDAALVFSCVARGEQLFGEPHHDVRLVHELTGAAAIGGMFCSGEIGPIGDRFATHGYTASILLLRDSARVG